LRLEEEGAKSKKVRIKTKCKEDYFDKRDKGGGGEKGGKEGRGGGKRTNSEKKESKCNMGRVGKAKKPIIDLYAERW